MNENTFIVARGVVVPTRAITSTYFSISKETKRELVLDEMSADPLVASASKLVLMLNVQVDPSYLPPHMHVEPDEDEEEDAEEEVEQPKRRRGRKSRAEIEAEAAAAAEKESTQLVVQEFSIPLEEVELESYSTPLSSSEPFVERSAESEKVAARLENNLALLAQRLGVYQSAVNRLGVDPGIDDTLGDLVPTSVTRETMQHTANAVEAQQNRVRQQVEQARAAYDQVIEWFSKRLFSEENITETIPFDMEFLKQNNFLTSDTKKLTAKLREQLVAL